jgi:hypothetical protein
LAFSLGTAVVDTKLRATFTSVGTRLLGQIVIVKVLGGHGLEDGWVAVLGHDGDGGSSSESDELARHYYDLGLGLGVESDGVVGGS